MRLTAFTDYSLRALMYLALEPEQRTTIPQIATAYGISEHHLVKVMHHLGRGGLVESVRGKGGGVRLAHAPGQIRLGSVVRLCEGEAAFVECLAPETNSCCITSACRLRKILADALETLYAALDAHTLADLVQSPQTLSSLLEARHS